MMFYLSIIYVKQEAVCGERKLVGLFEISHKTYLPTSC